MLTPVLHVLKSNPEIELISIALTTAGPIFASENLPYKGFHDYLREDDTVANEWGKKLAAEHHAPHSGIAEEESIAYLGINYADLITKHGESEAAKIWAEKGRHAFLPVAFMKRIIKEEKPDLVLTTNSPKSERAAVEAANNLDVPSLSLVDLFGIRHFHPLESTHIGVLCAHTIDNMLQEGVTRPREAFHVIGNPALDPAFDYRGPVDYAFRAKHFPEIEAAKPILLWVDMPAYWDLQKGVFNVRDDAEILRDLDDMLNAAEKNDGYLLVRPHPSQPREIYHRWLADCKGRPVSFAADVPLYPLLKAIDVIATYTSTVSVEALLMQRQVIQLKYHEGRSDMPLGEWGMAWLAEKREDLVPHLHEAFYNEEQKQQRIKRTSELLPQEKSGPKVAELIVDLLENPQHVSKAS
jgi:hypothetical protein